MFNTLKKATLVTALLAASAVASAATVFTVDNTQGTTDVGDLFGTSNVFNADGLAGTYNEVVWADGLGNFDATIVLRYNSFVAVPGTSLNATTTKLGFSYSLYSVINISGQVVSNNAPISITTGNWSGNYNMFLDVANDSDSDNPNITAFGVVGYPGSDTDDVELLSGTIAVGSSTGNQTQPGPPVVPASGGYTLQSRDVSLTAAGSNFFVAPNPFYENLISFGSLENFFDLVDFFTTGPQDFSGDASVTFVPEPSGIVLLGLGLFGVAYTARRKNA